MTKRKKIVIAVIAVAAVIAITGVVLLGIYFGTRRDAVELTGLPAVTPGEEYFTVVDKTDTYLGHPDLVMTGDGVLIAAYPLGHGKGEIALRASTDGGRTWSERRTGLPASFADSQETPTLYRLDFKDGSEKILLVSGCPSWGDDDEYFANGFNFSLSSDGGNTFTEFQNEYGAEWAKSMPAEGSALYDGYAEDELPNFDEDGNVLPYDVIVAMSSLTRLKDSNGEYIDAWAGTFHDYDFYNYVSVLTFDTDGAPNWSGPRRFLSDYRETESALNICEIEIFRTSDDHLVLFGRTNSRIANSVISVSSDEGKTWSAPKELPYSLTGDRHKAEFDPVSGKLFVSFRLYLPVKPNALSTQKCAGGYWVAWVGEPETLVEYALDSAADKSSPIGDKMIVLGKTNDGLSDCGYSGVVVNNGEIIAVSYGKFSEDAKYPYILAAIIPSSLLA